MTEKKTDEPVIADEERKQIIREVTSQAQRESIGAQIGVIIGNVNASDAKQRKQVADGALKAAKKHGVENAGLTEPERESIYQAHVTGLHRSLVELEFRAEAGQPVDTDALKSAIEQLAAFDWKNA